MAHALVGRSTSHHPPASKAPSRLSTRRSPKSRLTLNESLPPPVTSYQSPLHVLQFRTQRPIRDTAPLTGDSVLEVVSPAGARRSARVTQTPFMIGRGAETGNHLQLS